MKGFAEPVVTTSVFQVTMLPPSHVDYRLRLVEVVLWDPQAQGDRQWVVRGLLNACLGRDGIWDDEIQERGRGEAWLTDHRFDLGTALRLAREACPDVVVGILSTRQVLERDGVIDAPGHEAGRESEKVGTVASLHEGQGTARRALITEHWFREGPVQPSGHWICAFRGCGQHRADHVQAEGQWRAPVHAFTSQRTAPSRCRECGYDRSHTRHLAWTWDHFTAPARS